MIAIPDFVSGAMENWGLVTYRETALLYDEKTSSSVSKQHIASVIAHEFAHMWFGNLGKNVHYNYYLFIIIYLICYQLLLSITVNSEIWPFFWD